MTERLIGKRIAIPGQFTAAVTVESAKLLENTWLLRVRDRQGELHDAYLTAAEGYSTCEIHGGMNVLARKEAQKDFQLHKQICLATEAAGEGINLQFCRLMINYDLPWNPNRLEQRMGRIHRIGQKQNVYIFNFAALNTRVLA